MGRDIDTVKVDAAFAKRDSEGIWQINAPDRAALWKSFGYLQAHDRYFQIELVRHASLGRLSELMGEKTIGRDRLARVIASIAFEEFKKLPADSMVLKSSTDFVRGIEEWRHSANQRDPVEFKFLGLTEKQLPQWEPWHIYAISLYQAWSFSSDLGEEVRDSELQYVKGTKWNQFLNIKEASNDDAYLYLPSAVKSKLRKPTTGFNGKAFSQVVSQPSSWDKLQDVFELKGDDKKVSANFGGMSAEPELGASNAWIAYQPNRRLGPILCNDPHLHVMWPSSLYPIKYEIKDSQAGDLKATGWMLPGQPFLVSGALENQNNMYAWGITLANFANAQDRVVLSNKQVESLTSKSVKFKIRDPRTYRESVVAFDEKWSAWGPVASEWFDHDTKQTEKWAIDWIGFRGAKPPFQYFVERNFDLKTDTANKVAEQWQTPVVNLHWIAKDKKSHHSSWGHIVSGAIYSGVSSSESSNRLAISVPATREYYSSDSTDAEPTFLASGNQQIWKASESKILARGWGSPLRAQRVLEKRDQNFNTLGFSQIDDHSTLSLGFVKWARARISANKLCVDGPDVEGFFSRCQQNLAELDAWDGSMNQDDWRPSLVALWLAELKWRLWIAKNAPAKGAEITSRSEREMNLFVKWGISGPAQKLMWNVFNDPSFAETLKKHFALDLDSLVASSFTDAYTLLETSMGTDRSLWVWGNLHRVAWQHPLLSTLGPNLPFVGPSMSGTDDSPLRASSEWDPRYPLLFPVTHAAVERSCYDASGDHFKTQWTAISGPSGNPFSKWSQTFSQSYYFAQKWVEEKFFSK